jgi:hypothetical protein
MESTVVTPEFGPDSWAEHSAFWAGMHAYLADESAPPEVCAKDSLVKAWNEGKAEAKAQEREESDCQYSTGRKTMDAETIKILRRELQREACKSTRS